MLQRAATKTTLNWNFKIFGSCEILTGIPACNHFGNCFRNKMPQKPKSLLVPHCIVQPLCRVGAVTHWTESGYYSKVNKTQGLSSCKCKIG